MSELALFNRLLGAVHFTGKVMPTWNLLVDEGMVAKLSTGGHSAENYVHGFHECHSKIIITFDDCPPLTIKKEMLNFLIFKEHLLIHLGKHDSTETIR